MKRKLKTYLLLTVSLLMLVVEVFPHHHHNDNLCLNADIETCQSSDMQRNDGKHYPGDADKHTCNTSCITHFSFQTFSQHVDCAPDYAFFTILYSLSDLILKNGQVGTGLLKRYLFYYIEKLHARHFSAVRNFRAPPVV